LSRNESLHARAVEEGRPEPVKLRTANVGDGAALWRLVERSGGLELNSCYAYLLLSTHFQDTCVVAESGGGIVGFVTAYVPPTKPDVIFVWQIGVDASARRSGLGKHLLAHLVALPGASRARFLEATVAPSNQASRRLFFSFAEKLGVPCAEGDGFSHEDFGGESHETERLIRVGPMHKEQKDR
jgi:L-2,4-diaminobutyric acid acetyltransferase